MATVAIAQDDAGETVIGGPSQSLPGAIVLSESHGDWQVNCRVDKVEETQQRHCAVTRRQVNQQCQTVMSAEFGATEDGLAGVFVLAFGLAVTEPVTLSIDEGEAMDVPFTTCVPAGCIGEIDATGDMLASMRSGTSMAIGTQSADGAPIALSVSLTGFSAAAERVRELFGS